MMSRPLLIGALLCLSLTASAAPRRVVSLNLCTDQWLVMLAPDAVAGLTMLSRDPALSFVASRAADLPVVRASAEAVLARDPDLILATPFGARAAVDLLIRLGAPVQRFDIPTDFPALRATLRRLAVMLERSDRAEALIADMDARLDASRPPPGPARRTLVWQPRGWTAGPGGFTDAILRAAGLSNMGSGQRIGLEALARDPPDLLVIPGDRAGPSLATDLARHPALRDLTTRVLPTDLTICPVPFSVRAVERLVR